MNKRLVGKKRDPMSVNLQSCNKHRYERLRRQRRTPCKLRIPYAKLAGIINRQPLVTAMAFDLAMAGRMHRHAHLCEQEGSNQQESMQESSHGYILPRSIEFTFTPCPNCRKLKPPVSDLSPA